MTLLSFFVWDPDRIFFFVPFIKHPVTWYGVFFALGFLLGYFIIRALFTRHLRPYYPNDAKEHSTILSDRLAVLAILGTVFGARLGHVFLYGWPYYKQHLAEIFMVWEGGLASHGGAIGILLGIFVFYLWNRKRFPMITFLVTLDALVIPSAFIGGFIRIGNFINQEILGTATTLPWGVIFVHPIDGPAGIPLHPVQLYEAAVYLGIGVFLTLLAVKGHAKLGSGLLSGWFFTLVFGFRFFLEFVKLPESQLLSPHAALNMGQWLSIPFILLGLFLLFSYYSKRKKELR